MNAGDERHGLEERGTPARQATEDEPMEMLAEMDAEESPPSADDYAWARRVLGIPE